MWDVRDKVAVVGVGYSALTRRSPRTLAALTVEACDRAIADAGLTRRDIDGLATSPSMPVYGGAKGAVDGVDVVTPGLLSRLLGIEDRTLWTGSTTHMVTFSFIDAVNAVHSGACTHAIVFRSLHMPRGRYSDFGSTHAGGRDQFFAPYGFSMPASWAATVLRRYLDLHGGTRDSLANLVVDNRRNAHCNPNAYFRDTPLTHDQYLAARMIADPMTILDCDLPLDGAAAFVLTSAKRARDLPNPPALVTGYAIGTHRGATGVPMTLEDMWEGSAQIAERLWASAGLGASDIDVAQLYDGFSVFVYTWLEGLGLAPRGEALRLVDEGGIRPDGRLPVNTGGGALAEGRLHGMTHLAEAVLQVTGRGGERQVPGAARSVVTVSNGLAGSTAFVISRDDR
ncbi:thiolase family protein [Yinghuangia sp. ASG 101]|uniref:thiolase family protein n=1 Tax=Yinghuangia sp. ASG 101 TaxID=2896848 RepID=UPI001E62BA0C|nr:thiolase family protein [Yinghuangia sp. ASG 101]UGQ11593.1 thiolase family protein [Yinghuangia sp. ASG 101]